MTPEQKPEDLQSLFKEHNRLMRWLIRVMAFQAMFFVPVAVLILWIMIREMMPYRI